MGSNKHKHKSKKRKHTRSSESSEKEIEKERRHHKKHSKDKKEKRSKPILVDEYDSSGNLSHRLIYSRLNMIIYYPDILQIVTMLS